MPDATLSKPNSGMTQGMDAAPPKPKEDRMPEETEAAPPHPSEVSMPEDTEASPPKPSEVGMAEAEGTAATPPKPQAARPRPTRRRRRPRRYYYVDDSSDEPCGCKVARFICKTVCNFIGSVFTVFLLWLIYFRPYKVHPHVDAAALAIFDLSPAPAGNATALRYDLAINMSFFNSQRVYRIRFGHLTAGLYYNGCKLGPSDDTLPSFKLRARRHRTVYPALHGRASNVSEDMVEAFARERAEGQFNLDVRVKTTLTYRFWPTKTTYYYEYDCWLQFTPPPGNGTPAVTGGVKCGKHK